MFRRKGRISVLLAVGGLLIGAAPAAAAATRYASPTGTGDPTVCSQADPCDIQDAIENTSVQDGDDVVLLPGTYSESDEIDVTKAIDVHGKAGEAPPEIDTSSVFGVYSTSAGATLRRLRIKHTVNGWGLELISGTAERVIVESEVNGDITCDAANATIRDSVCWNHAASNGLALGVRQSGGGPYSVTLRNVTAVGSAATSQAMSVEAAAGAQITVDAKSVIAWGGFRDIFAFADANPSSSATVTLDHSNYDNAAVNGTEASVTAAGSGTNQTAAPVFVDPANGDFHQGIGAPTINAGAVDASSGPLDIDNEPRTMGTAPDIGADEFPLPPDTTITRHPRKRTTSRKARFAFTSDPPGASFECKLDSAAYQHCDSPKVYRGLARGRHVFRVQATDPGGTDFPPASFAWKIVRG